MPTLMSAASISPFADWLSSMFWSAASIGAIVLVIVSFVLAIFMESTARSVVIAFAVLYTGALVFSVLVIIFLMRSSAGGVMTYPTALAQIGLTYLAARIINDIVKGTYNQVWFMDLYYRLADRYFPSLDGSRRSAPDIKSETHKVDESESLATIPVQVATIRGRHAASNSNRSAA